MLDTMIKNLEEKTGKSLEEWVQILRAGNFSKHGDMVKFLKEEHGMTHGYANLVVHTARDSGPLTETGGEDLVAAQYAGKEHWKPLYERLLEEVQKFGGDVEVSPKKAYVSLRRKKQFATLRPASKARYEIGLNLRGKEPAGRLELEKPNAMCTHRCNLAAAEELDAEVLGWLREAYDAAG